MGLFSNNKKLCPICGAPTPRLLATKVEDTPICKECAARIDLPDGALDGMSLEDFRQYIDFYDENQALRAQFTESYHYHFGFFGGDLTVDSAHRLFRLKNTDGAIVFEAGALRSFRILEDGCTLFENGADALLCHRSDVPQRIKALEPQMVRFLMDRQEYDRMEHMARHWDEKRDGPEPVLPPRPTFEVPDLVGGFRVELTFDHPYWHDFAKKVKAPGFDKDEPSVESYLARYDEAVEPLHTLAAALMGIMVPGAGERWDGETPAQPRQAAAPVVDVVTELQRYKALLDSGVLTEEEFTAKKRQLLNL